jgi:hypothetical protein
MHPDLKIDSELAICPDYDIRADSALHRNVAVRIRDSLIAGVVRDRDADLLPGGLYKTTAVGEDGAREEEEEKESA